MASSINASTSAGVITTADTSGVLNIQTAGTTAISINASQAVSFTNSPTVTGGTANGVAYLNGSKVLTTGSALTFDGSTFVSKGATNGNIVSVGGSGTSSASYSQFQGYTGNGDATNINYVLVGNKSGSTYLGIPNNGVGIDVVYGSTFSFALQESEIMRLTSTSLYTASGVNVGVGTSSPNIAGVATALTVNGTDAILEVANGGTLRASVYGNASGGAFSGVGSSGIRFFTSASGATTLAVTIDTAQNLLVGTTSSSAYFDGKLRVAATGTCASFTTSTSGAIPIVSWNSATTGDNNFVSFNTEADATLRGSITYNRAGGLVAYNTTSDYRAKDISGPVVNSGTLIDSVPVYMGTMKGATQERPMFIAHETPAYAHTGTKDAVDKDGNPVYQQMDASALIPVMWAEIQSLRKRLAAANL